MTNEPRWPLFGVIPRGADPRELRYRQEPPPTAPNPLIDRDLGPWLPPVFTQEMSDCCANATVTALMTGAAIKGYAVTPLSRLALYSWGRMDMGTFPADTGLYPQAALDAVLARRGDCAEMYAPYQPDPAYVPNEAAVADCPAQDWLWSHQPFYASDPGGYDAGLMTALDAYRPVLVTMRWDEVFNQPSAYGILPAPQPSGTPYYHEVVAFARKPLIDGEALVGLRNSWGDGWGAHGNCWLAARYLASPGLIIDMRAVVGYQEG